MEAWRTRGDASSAAVADAASSAAEDAVEVSGCDLLQQRYDPYHRDPQRTADMEVTRGAVAAATISSLG